MSNLSEQLNELYDELIKAKSGVPALLQDGINAKEIDEILQERNIDFKLPQEIYSLYNWKNGISDFDAEKKSVGELSLFPLGVYTSFNFSLTSYYEEAIQYKSWHSDYFPIFQILLGDYYLFDNNKKSATFGMILFYSPSNPYIEETISIYDSLEIMISTLIACYRTGAYYTHNFDPNYLEVNAKESLRIEKERNPKSDYYKIGG